MIHINKKGCLCQSKSLLTRPNVQYARVLLMRAQQTYQSIIDNIKSVCNNQMNIEITSGTDESNIILIELSSNSILTHELTR